MEYSEYRKILIEEFARQAKWSLSEAEEYIKDCGEDSWEGYFSEEISEQSIAQIVSEDMSYWECE